VCSSDLRGGDAVRVACPRFNPATLGRLASLTLPLGFVLSLLSLNGNVPRYFIARYLGERELGVFASIAYIPVVGMTLVTALGDAVSPRLSKYYAARNLPAFRGLLLKLSGVAAVLGAVGILLAAVVGSN